MTSEKKPIQFTVPEPAKRAIRTAASRNDMSMAEFSKRAVLEALENEPVPDVDDGDKYDDLDLDPLEDFVESELIIEEDAGPIAKRRLYARFEEFCAEHYPEQEPETQHKLSRYLNGFDDVDDGRAYFERKHQDRQQERCFFNVRYSDDYGLWG